QTPCPAPPGRAMDAEYNGRKYRVPAPNQRSRERPRIDLINLGSLVEADAPGKILEWRIDGPKQQCSAGGGTGHLRLVAIENNDRIFKTGQSFSQKRSRYSRTDDKN